MLCNEFVLKCMSVQTWGVTDVLKLFLQLLRRIYFNLYVRTLDKNYVCIQYSVNQNDACMHSM